MKTGTLYGIGVGPGDPDLITVKGARILGECRHVFVPKARGDTESTALSIAAKHINPRAEIHEVIFPMTSDRSELHARWAESAEKVGVVLESGSDACFLTLGDTFLYSTYIYLLQALRDRIPDLNVETIPGITAFSAAAAIAEFPVGKAKEPVTIVPTADDLDAVKRALLTGGTVVLMKIGKRLGPILDILEEAGMIDHGVFISYAGMSNQRVEHDLRSLRNEPSEKGYLSILLIHARSREDR
ncbi:MAG TPA: precorrin-2 C(20)-methyltransferase [Desulfomonilaceae bacterium]|nr:precorrin-2 C(20)-methyltransferase [Desulfomonilaceae bacterium]